MGKLMINILIVSAILSTIVIWGFYKNFRMKRDQTVGLITKSQINESSTSHAYRETKQGPANVFFYEVDVEYEYSVDGQKYTSSRILPFGDQFFDARHKAEELIVPYPVNKQVSVYYNPDKPGDSCLSETEQINKPTVMIFLWFVFVIIFSVFGCIFMIITGKIAPAAIIERLKR